MFTEEEIREANGIFEKKEAPKPAKQEVVVKINEGGSFDFSNQQELANAAKTFIQMRLAPAHLSSSVESVMSALTMCKQLQLPAVAMNDMGEIKGRVLPYGNLVTALAERHPEYGEMKIFYIDEEQKVISYKNGNLKNLPWACVIEARKKNSDIWNEFTFTREEAETAGILTANTKKDSGWVKYFKDMAYHKCKNRCLNQMYASAVKGLVTYEEAMYEQSATLEREVSGADSINQRLGLVDVGGIDENPQV